MLETEEQMKTKLNELATAANGKPKVAVFQRKNIAIRLEIDIT